MRANRSPHDDASPIMRAATWGCQDIRDVSLRTAIWSGSRSGNRVDRQVPPGGPFLGYNGARRRSGPASRPRTSRPRPRSGPARPAEAERLIELAREDAQLRADLRELARTILDSTADHPPRAAFCEPDRSAGP